MFHSDAAEGRDVSGWLVGSLSGRPLGLLLDGWTVGCADGCRLGCIEGEAEGAPEGCFEGPLDGRSAG